MTARPAPKITRADGPDPEDRIVTVTYRRRRFVFGLLHRFEPAMITGTPGGEHWWAVTVIGVRSGAQAYSTVVSPDGRGTPAYRTPHAAAEGLVDDILAGRVPSTWGRVTQHA